MTGGAVPERHGRDVRRQCRRQGVTGLAAGQPIGGGPPGRMIDPRIGVGGEHRSAAMAVDAGAGAGRRIPVRRRAARRRERASLRVQGKDLGTERTVDLPPGGVAAEVARTGDFRGNPMTLAAGDGSAEAPAPLQVSLVRPYPGCRARGPAIEGGGWRRVGPLAVAAGATGGGISKLDVAVDVLVGRDDLAIHVDDGGMTGGAVGRAAVIGR